MVRLRSCLNSTWKPKLSEDIQREDCEGKGDTMGKKMTVSRKPKLVHFAPTGVPHSSGRSSPLLFWRSSGKAQMVAV